jgi:RNA polymerase sigma-70 factor (sigma-E family)
MREDKQRGPSWVRRAVPRLCVEPFVGSESHVVVAESELRGAEIVAALPTFQDVYVTHRLGMARLAYVIVGSKEAAEDLTQEAFARLHQHWDEVEKPVAFVRTVLTNLCRTDVRRQRRERDWRAALSPVTSRDAEVDETIALIHRLPFRQRAVVVLRYYADLPQTEIADILGCRLGTVKSAHHRALARLRKELSP